MVRTNAVRSKASEKGVSLKSKNPSSFTDAKNNRESRLAFLSAAKSLLGSAKTDLGLLVSGVGSGNTLLGFLRTEMIIAKLQTGIAESDKGFVNSDMGMLNSGKGYSESRYRFRGPLKGIPRTLKQIRKRKSGLLTGALSFAPKQYILFFL